MCLTLSVLDVFTGVTCEDDVYGFGYVGDTGVGKCMDIEVGSKTAKCAQNRKWDPLQNNCVLRVLVALQEEAKVIFTAACFPTYISPKIVVFLIENETSSFICPYFYVSLKGLDQNSVTTFVEKVKIASQGNAKAVTNSSANIATVVTLLNTISGVSENITVDQTVIVVSGCCELSLSDLLSYLGFCFFYRTVLWSFLFTCHFFSPPEFPTNSGCDSSS